MRFKRFGASMIDAAWCLGICSAMILTVANVLHTQDVKSARLLVFVDVIFLVVMSLSGVFLSAGYYSDLITIDADGITQTGRFVPFRHFEWGEVRKIAWKRGYPMSFVIVQGQDGNSIWFVGTKGMIRRMREIYPPLVDVICKPSQLSGVSLEKYPFGGALKKGLFRPRKKDRTAVLAPNASAWVSFRRNWFRIQFVRAVSIVLCVIGLILVIDFARVGAWIAAVNRLILFGSALLALQISNRLAYPEYWKDLVCFSGDGVLFRGPSAKDRLLRWDEIASIAVKCGRFGYQFVLQSKEKQRFVFSGGGKLKRYLGATRPNLCRPDL